MAKTLAELPEHDQSLPHLRRGSGGAGDVPPAARPRLGWRRVSGVHTEVSVGGLAEINNGTKEVLVFPILQKCCSLSKLQCLLSVG